MTEAESRRWENHRRKLVDMARGEIYGLLIPPQRELTPAEKAALVAALERVAWLEQALLESRP